MSTNYNRVILAGRITRDVKLSFTPAQKPVCDFGLAVNETWRGQDGEKREETMFMDCQAFGRVAEVINEHFGRGKPILVEGKLKFSTWERDGQKRSKHRVTVQSFEFLGEGEAKASPAPAPYTPPAPGPGDPGASAGGEDIPF
ncbi:MAG: single-stranded DNA-binding protein [Gammaproteobacteria bacterium]|nr:single-stranded DNA-binding protein [Gammaproteobacteria bacterium]